MKKGLKKGVFKNTQRQRRRRLKHPQRTEGSGAGVSSDRNGRGPGRKVDSLMAGWRGRGLCATLLAVLTLLSGEPIHR